jgi:osmoprotectant transport system permease protein
MSRFPVRAAAAVLAWGMFWAAGGVAQEVTVGSKAFTENVILGEVVTQLARNSGAAAAHRRELGGTQVLWNALRRGEIDAYPDYTGTIREEILAGRAIRDDAMLRQALEEQGIRISAPLGFNNTYALGMKEQLAEQLGIRAISDLRRHPELPFGFSNEFMERGDGWPSLRDRYQLPQRDVRGLDHDLAYRGLDSGAIQVIDLYSTDAEIRYYALRALDDDLRHFPVYEAVLLYRADLVERAPEALAAIRRLEGRISAPMMIEMNARAKLDRVAEARVAADFLAANFNVASDVAEQTAQDRFFRNTRAHLFLVAVSLTAAILMAVPLGVVAAKLPRAGQAILGIVGIIQTIPSLALLVFMIPLLGIGDAPAIVALFFYSLLPIVRNTYTGLHDIPLSLRESAAALGLPGGARLWRVELPMASRAILAGIKTSAVINVGTATLGALIGAGGYGQPIFTGIRLDNVGLILEGAVPAALLALLVQGLFEVFERVLVPKGLRLKPAA